MKHTERAYAKLNLTLDILGKRGDGYHEMEMVMQSITLHDTVTVESLPGDALVVDTGREDLPNDESNLAARGARAFFQAMGRPMPGLRIAIEKRIPAQAGMAGGSADAAATLRALRQLYAPTLPLSALEAMGEAVGSDVPYCVRGGTVLARGRGEVLEDLPALPGCFVVVCKPAFAISTPALFGRVEMERLAPRPDTQGVIHALGAGNLEGVARRLCNVFEAVLPPDCGEIFTIEGRLRAAGALGAAMTGSGSAVFALFREEETARRAYEALAREYPQTFLEKTR